MNIEYENELCWLKQQLQGTCNIDKSIFNDWFTGHLNFQIEHQYACFFIDQFFI